MSTIELELDRLYEYPTANDPAELPEQSGPRYPLVTIPRADMSLWALLRYLLRVWLWRRAARRYLRRSGQLRK